MRNHQPTNGRRRTGFQTCRTKDGSGEPSRGYDNGSCTGRERLQQYIIWVCSCLALTASFAASAAAQQNRQRQEKIIREIYVPFEDLDVLLEGQTRRVFLTRQQYEDLLTEAKKTPPEANAPQGALVVSADYQITVEEKRARVSAVLDVEVLEDGLHALALDLDGVGVRSATWQNTSASIGLGDDNHPVLFVEGIGRRQLVLEMVTPLETTAAQQMLRFQLPTPPATRLRLTVPGNVEMKSGATVQQRTIDEAAGVTRFQLLPARGPMSLKMSLNNRILRKQRVVMARSVLVDEITEAYQRLHATVSLDVLHGAADRFRFVLPDGFEPTEVLSPLLARWIVQQDEGNNVLEVILREPSSETVVLNVSATSANASLDDWSMPQLKPLDVAGQVTVVGLVVEDRLVAQGIEHQGLIPIDNAVLTAALPDTVFRAEPGAPQVRPVAAYYAPQGEYGLQAEFQKPPARLEVTTNLLLELEETSHHVRGGFMLSPDADKLFEIRFSVPALWHVTQVTDSDGKPLKFERYGQPDADSTIHVRLLAGVPPGEQTSVLFEATHVPKGWLGSWQKQAVTFPAFVVQDAASDLGAIAVRAAQDFSVRPEKLEQLSPLDENEKAEYGLVGVQTDLAYRYDGQPYTASMIVQQKKPTMTARCFSFLRIAPEGMTAHYEIVYNVQQARVRRLSLFLPENTPNSLSIRGLDGVVVKESSSELVDKNRRWTALLAERAGGIVRLAVHFQQPLPEQQLQDYPLPLVRADAVTYQSAVVAVEGHAELDIAVHSGARKIDVGELVAADYRVGRRLLGTYGFVGQVKPVSVDVHRRPGYGLPPAIVQRAELATLVSTSGVSQTAARYLLRTKSMFLEIQLPPKSELWSIFVDGKPAAPQREQESLLLSLPATRDNDVRDLQIVYETPVSPFAFYGNLESSSPVLLLRDEQQGPAREVPTADILWNLVLPEGHRVVRTAGNVFTDRLRPRQSPVLNALGALYMLMGGVQPTIQAARESARQTANQMVLMSPQPEIATTDEPQAIESYNVDGMMMDIDSAEEVEFEDFGTTNAETPPGEEDVRARVMAGEENGRLVPQTPMAQPAVPSDSKPKPALDVPLTVQEPPVPAEPELPAKAARYWALEGVRSLRIDLQRSGDEVEFRSLGVKPRLNITLVNERQINSLACGVGLAVFLIGVFLTRYPTRLKVKYVIITALAAVILPLLTGLTHELGDTFDLAFYAACCLVPYYLLVSLVRWLCGKCCAICCPSVPVNAAVLVLVALSLSALHAPAAPPETRTFDPAALLELLTPDGPVQLPKDAVIIPYESEQGVEGLDKAEKVLVPYDTYVELWNRAFPDQKLQAAPPVTDYSLAGAEFQATLAGTDHLEITGHLDFEVYADKPVSIPLRLQGGVLAAATLNGEPVRLQLVQPAVYNSNHAQQRGQMPMQQILAPNAPAQMSAPAQIEQNQSDNDGHEIADRFALLHVSTKGRKRLQLVLQLQLERRGGWRVVSGRLPAAPVTALALTVPTAQTEVKLTGVSDRAEYETDADNQQILTALDARGTLDLQWRPKVAEGQVDHSLTVQSEAILDVQEDGLRLVWKLDLQFPRSMRDAFSIRIPTGYLLEEVAGDNVRGWEIKQDGNQQQLDVTLLSETLDRETLTIHLAQRGVIDSEKTSQFEAPVISVDGAVLHKGRLTMRRSPLLELRTRNISILARTDIPDNVAMQLGAADATKESPLGLQAFQAFQFNSTPFTLALEADPIVGQTTADVQTLLKIADRETSLESRIILHVRQRPVHQVRVYVPETLDVEEVSAPGDFQWAVTKDQGRQLVSVYLAAGQNDTFSVVVSGSLGRRQATDPVAAPRVQVLDVSRQQGDLVVQIDPAFNVRAVNLQNCETVLRSHTFSWLQTGQRSLARLAMRYNNPDYAATLNVSARSARVSGYTVSNIKVTDEAIEETIILDTTIHDAGIREFSFLMPDWLQDARVSAPMLRQKIIENAGDDRPGWKRVRLELQDEIIGQFRVLVENDRLLLALNDEESALHEVPIPELETGRTDQRYVTVENAGRDEVMIGEQDGLESLGRQQMEWRKLATILGDGITTAYIVQSDATNPKLTFKTKQRKMVETAGAQIGLGETLLIVDASGAYRGRQTYHVNNTTEQFLEIRLPDGARLWTATVSGEPVKPTEVPESSSALDVRIPLIKTAEGDRDYSVIVKYGGTMPRLGTFPQIRFPLLHTVNIQVELSQVRLRLPESYRWLHFGGTMRKVVDEGEFQADYFLYNTKQVRRLMQVWSSDNPFAKVRVANNMKQIGLAMHNYSQSYSDYMPNAVFSKNFNANADAVRQAEQQTESYFQEEGRAIAPDNRRRLNEFWMDQSNGLARNVVTDLGVNFSGTATGGRGEKPADTTFNYGWLKGNKLENTRHSLSQTRGEPQGANERYQEKSQQKKPVNGKVVGKGVVSGFAKNLTPDDQGGQKRGQGQQSGRAGQAPARGVARSQRDLTRQYQQQLEMEQTVDDQSVQQWDIHGAIAQGEGGGQALPGGLADNAPASVDRPEFDGPSGAVPGTPATGTSFASLDVDFPERGREFMFTTPRGDIQITAYATSRSLVARLIGLMWVALGAVVLIIAYQVLRRVGPKLIGTPGGAAFLLVVGLISLIVGVFPVAALVLMILSVIQLCRFGAGGLRRNATAH